MFSPNGRWVAYTSNESGRYEIWVQAFDPEGGHRLRRQVSQNGGWMPVWHPNGQTLYFRSPSGDMMTAVVRTSPALDADPPQRLFGPTEMWPPHPFTDQDYVVLDDGSTLRFVRSEPRETLVNVILNFGELLKREVPTG